MENMLWLFNIIHTFVVFAYMQKIYGFRYSSRWINISAIIIFYTIHVSVNLELNATYNVIAEAIMFQIFGFAFFKEKVGKFYFNAMFQFYLIATDVLVMSGCAMFNNMSFAEFQKSNLAPIAATITFIIDLTTYKQVIKIFEHNFTAISSAIPIVIIFQYILILTASTYIEHYIVNIILMVLVVNILLNNVFSVYMTIYKQQRSAASKEASLYKKESDLFQKAAIDRKLKMDVFSDIMLNFDRHMDKGQSMKDDERQQYLDNYVLDIGEKLSRDTWTFECGHEIVNAAINISLDRAKRNGIEFTEDIQCINWNFISNSDLTVIMTDTINKAFENCEQANAQAEISVNIKRDEDAVGFRIISTCGPSQQVDEERFCHTAQEAVKKNRGAMLIKIKDTKCIVDIFIPIRN